MTKGDGSGLWDERDRFYAFEIVARGDFPKGTQTSWRLPPVGE